MGQSKLESLIESLTNIVVGIVIALAAQLLFFRIYDIHISLSTNVQLTGWMTLISIIRSYTLRRLFDKRRLEKLKEKNETQSTNT